MFDLERSGFTGNLTNDEDLAGVGFLSDVQFISLLWSRAAVMAETGGG